MSDDDCQEALAKAEAALKQKTDELDRCNRELEQFAYIAGHDLQEPLRMVTSYMALLEKRYQEDLDDDARQFIAFAVDGAQRMHIMVASLVTYSLVGTGQFELQPIGGNTAADQAIAGLQTEIEESGAAITCDPLPTVVADSDQLAQLLQNLIDNAIKYCRQHKPEIHIAAEERDAEWAFSVSDNGPGIESEYHERIFAMFQRLVSKDEYAGSGMGLAICRRIAERHGGRIWVESEPGKGAAFFFTISSQLLPA